MQKHAGENRGFLLRPLLVSLSLHALLLAAWEPAAPSGRVAADDRALEATLRMTQTPVSLVPEPAAQAPSKPSAPAPGAAKPARRLATSLAVASAVPPAPTFADDAVSSAAPRVVPAPAASAPQSVIVEKGAAQAGSMSAASAPEHSSVEPGPDAAGLRQFRLALASEARRFRRYPDIARREGTAGTAELAVLVSAAGLRRVELVRSSGHALLDAAAQEMMSRAAERAELPPSLHGLAFSVRVPVVFSLED